MAYDFNKIATNYDRLNHIMTLGMDCRWRRKAANTLCGKALDVACGTGDMVVELQKRGCTVTGVDLSEEMMAIARHKAPSATYMIADAEQMPFDVGSFDTVTCCFGVRNFVHLDKGLAEMARVLKSGGKMTILEMATPDSRLVRPFYNFYTRRVIPLLGKWLAGNREAYTYLPASIERFPKGEAMLAKLDAVGIKASQKKFFFGVCRMYQGIKN